MTTMFRFVGLGCLLSSALFTAQPATSSPRATGFRMEVLVDGRPVPEYSARGVRYVEALKGQEYAIRVHNPLGVRVAVALSIDGLNSIDARHTTAGAARKWVLDPYETITISGWQVNMQQARRFYFTTEEQSYAQRLGRPQDLGTISAVFFRERAARVLPLYERRDREAPASPGRAEDKARHQNEGAPAPAAESRAGSLAAQAAADECAATGIGDRTDHQVQAVRLDLEDQPAASIDIRYEYRSQLVRLGVLPDRREDVLARRQRARGFSAEFCPDVK